METLQRVLFEDPWWALIVLAAMETVLAAAWYRRRTGRLAWALAVPPLAGLAVWLTAQLVTTDREQIAMALRAVADGAVAGDAGTVGEYLDGTVRSPAPAGATYGRNDLIARARQALRLWPVRSVSLSSIETQVAGTGAATALSTRIVFADQAGLLAGQALEVTWRLQWTKRAEGWRIVYVEPVQPEALARWQF
jgi:hypothetical protein